MCICRYILYILELYNYALPLFHRHHWTLVRVAKRTKIFLGTLKINGKAEQVFMCPLRSKKWNVTKKEQHSTAKILSHKLACKVLRLRSGSGELQCCRTSLINTLPVDSAMVSA